MKGEKTGGRSKGTPNKATQKTREFINDLLENEQQNILDALESIRESNPVEYLKQWNALLEYGTPKLARTELVGDDKKPLSIEVTKTYDKK